MADKTLKISRLALLYKTYEAWVAQKSYVPLKGEVCLCEVPNAAQATTAPTVLFKVGNGVDDWEHLNWASALAADVYGWAKDANLDFTKLDQTFLDNLEDFIAEHSSAIDTKYQIVADGENKWKLQKSNDGQTWTDATGVIDLSTTIANLEAGVEANADAIADLQEEIAGLTSAVHFRGVIESLEDVTDPQDGDLVILEGTSKEYVYSNGQWFELGDEALYATKAELQEEVEARETAEQALEDSIQELEEAIEEVAEPREPVFDSELGVLFANGTPIVLSDSGTDNIVTYYGENAKSYQPNTLHIPYNTIVVGGGDGREKGQYFASASIVVNGGDFQRVFGGGYGAGSVGVTTVIMNAGKVRKGLHGGAMRYNPNSSNPPMVHSCSVGHAKVVLNGGTCQSVLSAGGIDMTDTGFGDLTVNGGSAAYCYASSANGTFGVGKFTMNGGAITHLLGTVRGQTQNIDFQINGGTITEMYAGADYDEEDFGTIKRVRIEANGGTITTLRIGTSNKAAGGFDCAGTYTSEVVIGNEATAVSECNLEMDSYVLNCNL